MSPTRESTGEPDRTTAAPTRAGSDPALEAELATFEADERERLGLPAAQRPQWVETIYNTFTTAQRTHTTVLLSGLTLAHDVFMEASLKGIGYRVQRIDCPDNEALWIGKEFGNRGLCNPSYFTVGNLLKFLQHLEANLGLTKPEIIEHYLLITANGCGPCRFGMYLTEYRKALRDSGFEGFRVLLIDQTIGPQQVCEGGGLAFDAKMIIALLKATMLGDILNLLTYRIRPYETICGATDAVVERCKNAICVALAQRSWLLPVLWRVRHELSAILVERSRIKPRVSLIGEFWAMTTEGEGNYRMQRFLEAEGAEVEIQPLSTWLLLLIWVARHDARLREGLPGADATGEGIAEVDVPRLMRLTWLIEKTGRIGFTFFARALGLYGFRLPDMEAFAEAAQPYYDTFNRGGEAHMEVAELLHNATHNLVNMTVSVKPFGCMPSSGISDGVQSYITEKYPRAIFLPVETTGDGAESVYSRLQMQLFKARRLSGEESAAALAHYRLREDEAREWLRAHPRFNQSLHRAPRRYGCTAADLFEEIGRRKWVGLWRIAAPLLRPRGGMRGMALQKDPPKHEPGERIKFFSGFLKHPQQVASIVPSSRFLKRRITEIANIASADTIVELGPGTGGTTRAILHAMRPDARLLAIEINPGFLPVLNRINDARLMVHNGNASELIMTLAAYQLDAPCVVISGIPFSTMPVELGQAIVNAISQVLAVEGRFVAYQIRDRIESLGCMVFGPARVELELLNIPPTRVYGWQKKCR